MSPRPRKATDDQVLAATARAMTRLGPTELTLADIAAEAGLTAGALVQRFGSKRQLLLALTARAAEGTATTFAELRAANPSPLAALREYAECFGHLAESREALARNLAYLVIDLTDPDFRRHLLVQARATRAAIHQILDAAVAGGELAADADTAALASTVEVAMSGALLTWACYEEGKAGSWVRRHVDTVLAPFVRRARRTR